MLATIYVVGPLHWEVMVVIEMVVGEKDGWEVHKVERCSPGSEGRLNVLNLNLLSFQLLEIIPSFGLRCASGNVFPKYLCSLEATILVRKTTTLSNMSSCLLARTTVPTALPFSINFGPNSSLSLSSVVSFAKLIVVVLVVNLVVRLVSNVGL